MALAPKVRVWVRGDNKEDSSKTNNHNNYTRKSKLLRIINDRKILEFLLSHNGRNIMHANGIDVYIHQFNHLYQLRGFSTIPGHIFCLRQDIKNGFF